MMPMTASNQERLIQDILKLRDAFNDLAWPIRLFLVPQPLAEALRWFRPADVGTTVAVIQALMDAYVTDTIQIPDENWPPAGGERTTCQVWGFKGPVNSIVCNNSSLFRLLMVLSLALNSLRRKADFKQNEVWQFILSTEIDSPTYILEHPAQKDLFLIILRLRCANLATEKNLRRVIAYQNCSTLATVLSCLESQNGDQCDQSTLDLILNYPKLSLALPTIDFMKKPANGRQPRIFGKILINQLLEHDSTTLEKAFLADPIYLASADGSRYEIHYSIWSLLNSDAIDKMDVQTRGTWVWRILLSCAKPEISDLQGILTDLFFKEAKLQEIVEQGLIADELLTLSFQKLLQTEQSPSTLYFILWFYIRRNHSMEQELVSRLLALPEVQVIAHTGPSSIPADQLKLLSLASAVNHQHALALLAKIPLPTTISFAHLYHVFNEKPIPEELITINQASLFCNYESAVIPLTLAEKEQVKKLTATYRSQIEAMGGATEALQWFRVRLQDYYQACPATIELDGQESDLPLTWEQFQSLALSEEQQQQAKEAYHTHAGHSAYRLFLPAHNPWLAHNAMYIKKQQITDSSGQIYEMRCADYHELKELAIILFCAATDPHADPETTPEERVAILIQAFADTVRAHNEDGEQQIPDHPSCQMGMKRRFLQGLPYHCLKLRVDEEILTWELREWYLGLLRNQKFKNRGNQIQLVRDTALAYFEDPAKEIPGSLKLIDVTSSEIEAFRAETTVKYQTRLPQDLHPMLAETLNAVIDKHLRLERNQAHFTKLYQTFNLGRVTLTPTPTPRVEGGRSRLVTAPILGHCHESPAGIRGRRVESADTPSNTATTTTFRCSG